jgi:hypothetical protein
MAQLFGPCDTLTSMSAQLEIRARALLAWALLVAIGLPSKWYEGPGKSLIVGQWWDLWGAAAVFFLARVFVTRLSALRLALVTWALLMLNEFLQLAEGPFWDTMRQTKIGAFVLGSDFSTLDIITISAGHLLAIVIDRKLVCTAALRSPQS